MHKRHEAMQAMQAMQALRDVVRAKLAAGTPKAVAPLPPPRYDDVFEEGTSWFAPSTVERVLITNSEDDE